jgi:hypothetical protein
MPQSDMVTSLVVPFVNRTCTLKDTTPFGFPTRIPRTFSLSLTPGDLALDAGPNIGE